MFKSTLVTQLKNDYIPEEFYPVYIGQGYGYKKDIDWEQVSPEEVIYIPEYGYRNGTICEDSIYTKKDFIDITGGDNKLAQELFEDVDWQHPETLYDEWEVDNENG